MTIKLIAFDVDGTLSDPDKSIEGNVSERLRALEDRGLKILLISGKSAAYLSGLARGLGIKDPLVAGENGCVILKPLHFEEICLAEKTERIDHLRTEILSRYGNDVWLQPNQVAFTVFPKQRMFVSEIYQFMIEALTGTELQVLKHIDAIDVLPANVHKGKALALIKKMLYIMTDEVIAVGDAESDLAMADEAGTFLIIGDKITYKGAHNFNSVLQALQFLEAKR